MRTTAVLLAVATVAAAFFAPGARAAHEEWPLLLKAFKSTWKIDGLENPGLRSKLRAKKRSAVKGLRKSHDARAIPVLLGAHKKQQRFIEKLKKQWVTRKAKWEKLKPAMDRSLNAKTKASTDGKILVTPAEQEWIKEKGRLETLWREVTNEQEIAEYTRKAMARVANTVEGKEHTQALTPLLKAAGNGQTEDQREFVRVLGFIKGDEATAALEKYASDIQPFVAQTALEALGRQQCPRSIDTLLGRLDDPRWQLRVAALRGLSYYREARIVEALLERLPREDGVLKRHYYTALSRIIGETLPATLEAWKSFWKANKELKLTRWAEMPRRGPVVDDLPPVEVKSEASSGSTSFYGIKTESKHIIFIIDISGSMGEQGGKDEQGQYRIDIVKRELTNAIRSLTASESDERGAASFNIVAYAADVRVYKKGKMIPATKKNKERAFEWVNGLEAIGATNIFDAIEQAFEIIATRKAKKQLEKGADTIFLMTDGQPNRGRVIDPILIRKEVRKMNRERKLTIHTIGVGKGHSAAFLKALAAENDGEYLAR